MSLDGEPLACPACGGRSDLASWLDRTRGGTPGGGRVAACCPRCEAEAWLELRSREAAVGELLPGRPPLFRPVQRTRHEALCVEAGLDGLVVCWLRRRWVIRPASSRRPPSSPESG